MSATKIDASLDDFQAHTPSTTPLAKVCDAVWVTEADATITGVTAAGHLRTTPALVAQRWEPMRWRAIHSVSAGSVYIGYYRRTP